MIASAKEHDEPEPEIHHADLLVIDGGDPLRPQIAPLPKVGDQCKNGESANDDDHSGSHDDRFM
jgi:hypothetical protein